MAFGGLASGFIYDVFASYRMAFLDGFLWTLLNLGLVSWILLHIRPKPRPMFA